MNYPPGKMSTEKADRTQFANGHFLTGKQDDPKSFPELARRYAPGLREVCSSWPGLPNGRARLHKRENDGSFSLLAPERKVPAGLETASALKTAA